MFASILGIAALAALGDEPVSFEKTVAPIFRTHCVGCHRPKSTKGKFDLSSYQALMRPSKSGAAVEPGRGAASLLVRMMTGEVEPTMPKDAELLDKATVDRVRRWIDQGAKFDGTDPNRRIDEAAESPTTVGGPGPVVALAFHPKSGDLAVGVRGAVAMVDAATGKPKRILGGAPARIHRLAFSKNGDRLLAAGGTPGRSGKLLLWSDGKPAPQTLLTATDVLYAVAFSPDESLMAAAGADRVLYVLDAKSQQTLHRVESHADLIRDVAFHPNGRSIATASRDRTVKMWDRIDRDVSQSFRDHTDGVYALTFGPKGDRLFSVAGDRTLRTWKTENGKQDRVENLPDGPSLSLTAAPGGERLAVGGADGFVRIRRTSGGEIRRCGPLGGWIYATAFSADGKLIAAADCHGGAAVFETETGGLRMRFDARRLVTP